MTGLPDGWASGSLSDFIEPRGEKVSPSDFPDMPFIGMDHVEPHTTKIVGYVPSRQMKSSASRFYQNDVLYGRLRPYLNKVAQPGFDGLASGEFIVFEGNARMEPSFLRYRLHARDFVSFASHLNEGDRPRVNFKQIGNFRVLVPPREEQGRIVEKIEALFDEIDRGVESLRAAKRRIEQYRQSLLKAAFEGRLTADWRAENPDLLESSTTLLSRIKEKRLSDYQAALRKWEVSVASWKQNGSVDKKPAKPKQLRKLSVGLPDEGNLGWATVPLGQVVEDPIYGTSKKCGYGTGSTGVLRIPNIRSGHIDSTDLKSADFDDDEKARFSLQEGDILTIRSNGSLSIVGKSAIIQRDQAEHLFAGYLIRLRPIAQLLAPMYLRFVLMEPQTRVQIEAKAKSTSGVNNISARELQEILVPFCSLVEQVEVIQILDNRLDAANRLEAEIDSSLACADALRQSVLKQAFSGNLVPQDPGDEPASVLLERTKTENAPKSRKRSNGKREVARF